MSSKKEYKEILLIVQKYDLAVSVQKEIDDLFGSQLKLYQLIDNLFKSDTTELTAKLKRFDARKTAIICMIITKKTDGNIRDKRKAIELVISKKKKK